MADDLGMGDLSYLGGQPQTPVIDQLAADGIRLSNFHAFPLCSPSRAALLTGRSPLRYGLAWSPLPPWSKGALPSEEVTLAEQLSEAGYRTALVGKWHLGHTEPEHHPNQHGFDHFYGCLNGAVDYTGRNIRGGGLDWQRNGVSVSEAGYTTHLIGNEAQQVIQDHNFRDPLFLFVSFTAPHIPLQAPDQARLAYAHIENQPRQTFCSMVSEMDTAIGQVISSLEQRNQQQNTLLLFLSDNGSARDSGGVTEPYRGGKGSVFEGGIKVPAVMVWPGQLAKGEFTEFTTVLDLAPTLQAAAGLKSDLKFDGRNFLTSLPTREADGSVSPQRKGQPIPPVAFVATTPGRAQAAMLHNGYKYVRRVGGPGNKTKEWLYFLPDDPLEKQNLIESDPERAHKLRDDLAKWLALGSSGISLDLDAPSKEEEPADWQAPEDWAKR